LDENRLAEATQYFAVGTAIVSHDHGWLAYSTDVTGNEKYALQFRPLEAGTPTTAAPETVPEVGYGLAWSAASDHVFYVRLDEAQRPFQLWRHRLGTDPSDDALVYEEIDRRFALGTGTSRDGAYVLVSLHSTNTTEWLALDSADPLGTPAVVLARREGIEYSVDHLAGSGGSTAVPTVPARAGHGWFVVATNEAAPDFRVLAAPDAVLGGGVVWTEVVSHRPGVRVEDVDAFEGALVLSERCEAQTRVRVLPLGAAGGEADADGPVDGTPFSGDLMAAGWLLPAIDNPSSTWLGPNLEPDPATLRIGRTSMVTPSSVVQVDLDTRSETLLKQEPVLGGFDPLRYTTARLWAEAPDGTPVPISVVHRKGLELPAPTVLYGYGAYEISIDPTFSHHRLSLLDRGAVFAIAHVRGGGEMGRSWYENGRMEHKANTFSDFVACARHLVGSAISRPGALAGRGGSAGGLLIGAVANMAPHLFRALVAEVPFVDCVTTMLDDSLPLTVGEWEEWGNPARDETAYRRMLTYSPYDNVTGAEADGAPRRYPDLYVTAGLNDPRVGYWEPAKWVAKLRALSPSTRVLLRTEMGAGHAGPSGRYDAWKDEALVLAFLVDALELERDGPSAAGPGDDR
jgi:oligopeptidase B